jgi:multiple sugar transport system permease protein
VKESGRRRPFWQRVVLHAVLIVLSAVFLVPLFWLIGSSLKTDDQIRAFPPEWLPDLPFYTRESPYIDRHEAEKALREATGPDAHAKALASAYRAFAVGDVTFQGEAAGAEALSRSFSDLQWRSVEGALNPKPADIEGRRTTVLAYTDKGKGDCGTSGAEIAWGDSLSEFHNATLQVHGDRSWRYVDVCLATPVGAFRTNRPILLASSNWQDVILIRQAKGSIPWGTYRLVTDPSGQPTTSGGATLELEVLSASRLQVILRKLLHNYPSGLTFIPFGRYLLNTLLICALVVFGTLISCSLVAYGLARIRWRGRNALFYIIIATMMLPFQVTMVPLFVVFARLGWVDTFLPLIVPAFFGNAFFIFLLRQFFMTIPDELADAARIDGCSEWDIYGRIVLPLAKPALATVGLFAFMGTWNDYVGPLIYLSDTSKYTLSLGLATFSSQYGSYPGMLMAVTAVMTIPIIILFFLAQRTFIQGITLTGIKG